jgi:hypothetical protein
MLPALAQGDRLVVIRTGSPLVGDVVALHDPVEPARLLVKRVVAVLPAGLGFISGVVDWVTAHFGEITDKVSNVLNDVVGYFTRLPNRIVTGLGNIVATVWGGLVGSGDWVYAHVIQPVIARFTSLPSAIANAIGSGLSSIAGIGSKIIDAIIRGVNDGINAINAHIPSVLGFKIFPSLPDIPLLAAGGLVQRPTLAILGESGPELVVPLGGVGGVTPYTGSAGGTASTGGGTGVTYSPTYTLAVQGDCSPQTVLLLKQMLEQHDDELVRELKAA